MQAIVAAFHYHLLQTSREAPAGSAFGPMWEMGGQIYPLPLDRVPDVGKQVWAEAYEVAPIPEVAARLADLLWEVKYGKAHEYARAAIDNYLANTTSGAEPIEITFGLQRALSLSKAINDGDRQSRAVTAILDFASAELESNEVRPGVSLRLLETLAELRAADRPSELGELLGRAESKYGSDPWHRESIQEIRARLAAPEDQATIWLEAVNGYVAEAHQSTGLRKLAILVKAIELADAHGLTARASEIRVEVQGIGEDELELHEVSSTTPVPRDVLDRFHELIVGDDSIEDAFVRFGLHRPVQDAEKTADFVAELMNEFPFSHLATSLHFDPSEGVAYSLQDFEEKQRREQIRIDATRIQFFGVLATETLQLVRERYGPLAGARQWFIDSPLDGEAAGRIGRALERYDEGDYDSAGVLLTPAIERAIRRAAADRGIPISRGPGSRGRAGDVLGLGEILYSLKPLMDPLSFLYLWTLLCEQSGMNLRNRVAHGINVDVDQQSAALLLHAGAHLRCLVSSPDEAPG